jgi:iron complex outermembrane receptor protein
MREVRNGVRCGLIAVVCFVWAVASAHAQTRSDAPTLAGDVMDPDGKVIVDAALLIRNETTNEVRTTNTDANGRFSVSGLSSGAYTIEVVVPGFELVRQSSIQVMSGRTKEVAIRLSVANIAETVTISSALPEAAVAAPSQGSLSARSAQSLISNEYIRNYTSPFSDYSQVLQMAPGTFSVSANGPGLGDTKTFFRGLPDGFYTMMFDGIPFGDTNDPTHHSWVFFPATTIGSTVFDRSPGSASTVGQSTYGGSVNLLSRSLPVQQQIGGTVSYGSFNTRLFDVEFDSGRFGNGKSRLLLEAHEMRSDGYQTFNFQKRDAFQAKYQYALSDNTSITAYSSIMNLHANTPDQKGSTRAQVQQFGDNFLLTDDPTSPLYYKFNFYRVPTHFEYAGFRSYLGQGWSIDDKVYTMRYYNHQNFNSTTKISTTSATDKLNSYWKWGNLLPVSHVSNFGVFRTGLWTEYASTDRFQTPSDPHTWIDAAVPNFHEMFGTTTVQPYAEYEMRLLSNLTVTPGLKLAYYKQDFTQFADNGNKIGNLNGAPFLKHAVSYHSWLPSLDARYLLQPYWSVYGQYGKGQNIPPTSIFDVPGAAVSTTPKPILSDTFQAGSVWKSRRATLDVDVYRINLQNSYSSSYNVDTGLTDYFLNSKSLTQGVEAESTLLVGRGLAVYVNGAKGTAKYTDSKSWVASTPADTETIGLTYNLASWNLGLFSKRVGKMWNDNGALHEAIATDPFNITNLFVNYTLRGRSKFSSSRIRFAVNNLTDSHAITAVKLASKTTVIGPNDLLTLMSGRSVSVSFTVGFTPQGTP